ncbi:MAG: Lrp/AsnC family transcriptional regulator [Verrucomicrobiota bacterium]|nr:Lrp/AsnC family transcriptional regulator [Verrucomicrobiota bacterium]
MDQLIQLLQENARYSITDLSDQINLSEEEIKSKIAELEESGAILGYAAVVDSDKVNDGGGVSAFIEVKLTPERGGGFDRLATRIAKIDEVESCMLMSGGYDLSVVISGSSLNEVASFVAEKLSTLEGVISTATHFQLKTYKSNGFLASVDHSEQRLPVSP